MAGQPKYRQMVERIEELGGIDWLSGEIADGRSQREVAAELGYSRSMLGRWIRKDPDRVARCKEAQLEGASAMVEEGRELLDNADEKSTAGVQKARSQADFRRWWAGVIDRPSFGPPDQRTSINVLNIENLHLAALQAQGSPEAQLVEAVDVPQLESGDEEPWETSETEEQ